MPRTTRGGELLRTWLREERRTQEWLGEQIGTHQTNVSAWVRGRPIPLDMAIEVRRLTGIEVETWVQPSDESGPLEEEDLSVPDLPSGTGTLGPSS